MTQTSVPGPSAVRRTAFVIACVVAASFLETVAGWALCAPRARPWIAVRPKLALPSVETDADDCAIWIHPTDPSKSLVIGNDKRGRKAGLYVYDLDGRIRQFVSTGNIDNLDVRYGMALGGRTVDICAAVRGQRGRIRVFAVDPETLKLTDVTAAGGIATGFERDGHGLALYRRPSDGATFALVTDEPARGRPINQIRLADDGTGKVKGTLVRSFGASSLRSEEAEGMVVDDELGFLYVADENHAVLKFHADPDRGNGLVSKFAIGDGIRGDREGIAIYKCRGGTGYILLSSQGNNTVKVYAREGENRFLATVNAEGAHKTDGLDVTSCPAGPRFPNGFLVCHNDRGRNFVLYAWEDVAAGGLKLRTDYDPRKASVSPARERR